MEIQFNLITLILLVLVKKKFLLTPKFMSPPGSSKRLVQQTQERNHLIVSDHIVSSVIPSLITRIMLLSLEISHVNALYK